MSKVIYTASCQVTYPSVIDAWVLSPLPATPKLSSSITKGLRQKGRKYISSSSSNLDEEDTTKTKPCAGTDVVPYEVKEVPNSLYKPSATVLSALLQDLLKQ